MLWDFLLRQIRPFIKYSRKSTVFFVKIKKKNIKARLLRKIFLKMDWYKRQV